VLSAKYLFHVPLRGSVTALLAASTLYVLVALGIGLVISSWVKNQLVASQLTMLATFMPAFMLSGFLFDLRSMPTAIRLLTYALPRALLRRAAANRVSRRRCLVGTHPRTQPALACDGCIAGPGQAVPRTRKQLL